MANDSQPTPLSYAGRGLSDQPPNPIAVTAMCLPGLACWCLLAAPFAHASFQYWIGIRISADVIIISILSLWAIAVVFALFSFGMYSRLRPKPWYVWLNLIINGAGFLFTIGVFVFIAWQ